LGSVWFGSVPGTATPTADTVAVALLPRRSGAVGGVLLVLFGVLVRFPVRHRFRSWKGSGSAGSFGSGIDAVSGRAATPPFVVVVVVEDSVLVWCAVVGFVTTSRGGGGTIAIAIAIAIAIGIAIAGQFFLSSEQGRSSVGGVCVHTVPGSVANAPLDWVSFLFLAPGRGRPFPSSPSSGSTQRVIWWDAILPGSSSSSSSVRRFCTIPGSSAAAARALPVGVGVVVVFLYRIVAIAVDVAVDVVPSP